MQAPQRAAMSPSTAASIVFLAVSLTLLQTSCGAADDNNTDYYPLDFKCSSPNESMFEVSHSGSNLFKNNLGQFLAKLPSSAISNRGFFNGTAGSAGAAVFGMAICLADIPWPGQCERCLHSASTEADSICQSGSIANIVYQGCVLRYSDTAIFAEDFGDDTLSTIRTSGAQVADTAAFAQTRKELFTALASDAVGSSLMIASGNRSFNSTHKLYGLVQCSRDLPRKLCSSFINSTIGSIPSFRPELQRSEGFSIIGFSFYIRYDLKPFTVYWPHTGTTGPSRRANEAKDVPPHTGTGPPRPEAAKAVPGTSHAQSKGGLVQQVEVIVIPVSFIILIFLGAFIVIRHYQNNGKKRHYQSVTGLRDFPFGDIKSATKNFNNDNFLGEGGFGKVYKGTFNIENNKDLAVAVKCVANPSAAKPLKAELEILVKLQHKNVVRVVGFCNNDGWFRRGRGLYVCNEYISNGSLDQHIFGASTGQSVLEWRIRCQIIRGICTGLKYLHQESNSSVVHMDLKPNNILLDDEMTPKIADFGLSRTFLNTKTHTYTKVVKGSNGYIAPEFLERGKVGRPCDIYSLGVLILAIVMGVGPTAMRDPGGIMFINKVRAMFIIDLEATNPSTCSARDREQLRTDASLMVDDCIEDVEKCAGLALECVNEEPKYRPTAEDICTRLNQVFHSDNRVHTSY